MAHAPGNIRDAIVAHLSAADPDSSVAEITEAVAKKIGGVSPSSVRSYLNLNVPNTFERTDRGRHRLKKTASNGRNGGVASSTVVGKSKLILADCFEWLAL
jgi:hypothetical protein